MKDNLLVSLVQTSIHWQDRKANLTLFRELISPLKGQTDLVVLPEMFTTGFTMSPEQVADNPQGETIENVKTWAYIFNFAIMGSFIVKEKEAYYNRAFFVTPEGDLFFYDKRHLFRMGCEDKHYQAGKHSPTIAYKGWNIRPLICYDLRFPVWSRNVANKYDLLIYMANWPEARAFAWRTLLPARAIENLAYVCGVNRIGTDGLGFPYRGDSVILSPKGQPLAYAQNEPQIITTQLSKSKLNHFRSKFPADKDADKFKIY